MSIYYVYVYLRSQSSSNGEAGTPYYVGKGKNNRIFDDHSTCACNRPKDKRFTMKVFEGLTNKEASHLEIALIKIFGRIDLNEGCLRNKTNGGEGSDGYIHSKEAKKKMSYAKQHMTFITKNKISAAKKGGTLSEEHKKKISQSNIGRKLSLEAKQKISKVHKGKPKTYATKNSSSLPEVKLKISNMLKGRKLSSEHKNNISLSISGEKNPNYGKKMSEEQKSKLAAANKKYWYERKLNEQTILSKVS